MPAAGFAATFLFLAAVAPFASHAQRVREPAAQPGPAIRVQSVRALRDAGVVRQQRDYSCGAAALATLLTYGLDHPIDEATLLQTLLEPMAPEQLVQLQKTGLSLRQLQLLADDYGYKAQGFRLGADQLPRLQRPVIVFVRPGGYPHFAVLKGVRDGRAYLADPSLGNVRLPLHRFLDQWADENGRGIIFAIERPDGTWPRRSALEVAETPQVPLETESLLNLLDRTVPAGRILPPR